MARTYLNSNGLVDGKIPAGEKCPFLRECELACSRCPGFRDVKPVDYSCAAARAHSISKEKREDG